MTEPMFGDGKQEEAAAEQEAASTPPQYASAEAMAAMATTMEMMRTQLETMSSAFNAVLADRQSHSQTAAPAQIADLSDQELEEIVRSGEGGHKLRQLMRGAEQRLENKIQALQQQGFGAIGNMQAQLMGSQLPYFTTYKKEIDELLNTLSAEQRLNPEVFKTCHDVVVARHMPEIIQAEVRKALNPQPATSVNTGGRGNGRTAGIEEDKGADDLLTRDELAVLRQRGMTQDQFAQRMGFKTWKEYASVGDVS